MLALTTPFQVEGSLEKTSPKEGITGSCFGRSGKCWQLSRFRIWGFGSGQDRAPADELCEGWWLSPRLRCTTTTGKILWQGIWTFRNWLPRHWERGREGLSTGCWVSRHGVRGTRGLRSTPAMGKHQPEIRWVLCDLVCVRKGEKPGRNWHWMSTSHEKRGLESDMIVGSTVTIDLHFGTNSSPLYQNNGKLVLFLPKGLLNQFFFPKMFLFPWSLLMILHV